VIGRCDDFGSLGGGGSCGSTIIGGAGGGSGGCSRPLRIIATITTSLTPASLSFLIVAVSMANTERSTSMSASSTGSDSRPSTAR
jgi:hypothetical protein